MLQFLMKLFRPVGASRLATSGAVARVTRVALFSACMRGTTPRGLKARSMSVAPATAGRLRKPQNSPQRGETCAQSPQFFSKNEARKRKFFANIKNKKQKRKNKNKNKIKNPAGGFFIPYVAPLPGLFWTQFVQAKAPQQRSKASKAQQAPPHPLQVAQQHPKYPLNY